MLHMAFDASSKGDYLTYKLYHISHALKCIPNLVFLCALKIWMNFIRFRKLEGYNTCLFYFILVKISFIYSCRWCCVILGDNAMFLIMKYFCYSYLSKKEDFLLVVELR